VRTRTNKFLGTVPLMLPQNVVGMKIFTIKYRMHELINSSWIDLGLYPSDEKYFVSVYPTPLYRVFVSRGLGIEDRAIGDPIANTIREWGFETVTVGIELAVPEEEVPRKVRPM